MGALDCNEFENLKRRKFDDYSLGHRIMYEVPVQLLRQKRWTICEAGFGIGWGLGRMLKEDVVEKYTGYEPNADSYNHVRGNFLGHERLELIRKPFEYPGRKFDHVFCIETIEHVPMDAHEKFLADLRRTAGSTLWLSTPDSERYKTEGVRTFSVWKQMLHAAGFRDVTVHREQWTVLFICQ